MAIPDMSGVSLKAAIRLFSDSVAWAELELLLGLGGATLRHAPAGMPMIGQTTTFKYFPGYRTRVGYGPCSSMLGTAGND